jgi:hypothetical protein
MTTFHRRVLQILFDHGRGGLMVRGYTTMVVMLNTEITVFDRMVGFVARVTYPCAVDNLYIVSYEVDDKDLATCNFPNDVQI